MMQIVSNQPRMEVVQDVTSNDTSDGQIGPQSLGIHRQDLFPAGIEESDS